jgi:dihydroxyacetone kinase DhaKLM complex PTS-EIIA-like component DhaM
LGTTSGPVKVENIESIAFNNDLMTVKGTNGSAVYTSLEGISYAIKKTNLAKETSTLALGAASASNSKILGDIVKQKLDSKEVSSVAFQGVMIMPFSTEKLDRVTCVDNVLSIKIGKFVQYQNFDAVRAVILLNGKLVISF